MIECHNASDMTGGMMHTVEDAERELTHYLRGVVEGWHKGPTPTEQDVWKHVHSVFSKVESEEHRRRLQEQTVDLLEEALTFTRLDT